MPVTGRSRITRFRPPQEWPRATEGLQKPAKPDSRRPDICQNCPKSHRYLRKRYTLVPK